MFNNVNYDYHVLLSDDDNDSVSSSCYSTDEDDIGRKFAYGKNILNINALEIISVRQILKVEGKNDSTDKNSIFESRNVYFDECVDNLEDEEVCESDENIDVNVVEHTEKLMLEYELPTVGRFQTRNDTITYNTGGSAMKDINDYCIQERGRRMKDKQESCNVSVREKCSSPDKEAYQPLDVVKRAPISGPASSKLHSIDHSDIPNEVLSNLPIDVLTEFINSDKPLKEIVSKSKKQSHKMSKKPKKSKNGNVKEKQTTKSRLIKPDKFVEVEGNDGTDSCAVPSIHVKKDVDDQLDENCHLLSTTESGVREEGFLSSSLNMEMEILDPPKASNDCDEKDESLGIADLSLAGMLYDSTSPEALEGGLTSSNINAIVSENLEIIVKSRIPSDLKLKMKEPLEVDKEMKMPQLIEGPRTNTRELSSNIECHSISLQITNNGSRKSLCEEQSKDGFDQSLKCQLKDDNHTFSIQNTNNNSRKYHGEEGKTMDRNNQPQNFQSDYDNRNVSLQNSKNSSRMIQGEDGGIYGQSREPHKTQSAYDGPDVSLQDINNSSRQIQGKDGGIYGQSREPHKTQSAYDGPDISLQDTNNSSRQIQAKDEKTKDRNNQPQNFQYSFDDHSISSHNTIDTWRKSHDEEGIKDRFNQPYKFQSNYANRDASFQNTNNSPRKSYEDGGSNDRCRKRYKFQSSYDNHNVSLQNNNNSSRKSYGEEVGIRDISNHSNHYNQTISSEIVNNSPRRKQNEEQEIRHPSNHPHKPQSTYYNQSLSSQSSGHSSRKTHSEGGIKDRTNQSQKCPSNYDNQTLSSQNNCDSLRKTHDERCEVRDLSTQPREFKPFTDPKNSSAKSSSQICDLKAENIEIKNVNETNTVKSTVEMTAPPEIEALISAFNRISSYNFLSHDVICPSLSDKSDVFHITDPQGPENSSHMDNVVFRHPKDDNVAKASPTSSIDSGFHEPDSCPREDSVLLKENPDSICLPPKHNTSTTCACPLDRGEHSCLSQRPIRPQKPSPESPLRTEDHSVIVTSNNPLADQREPDQAPRHWSDAISDSCTAKNAFNGSVNLFAKIYDSPDAAVHTAEELTAFLNFQWLMFCQLNTLHNLIYLM